ncbi:MAG: hypothetical protein HYW51_02955 [Candidatus Doudnabacteria bacterium]|nr:hypothetical protein [Candidatus Doudnabacteria bacterium]
MNNPEVEKRVALEELMMGYREVRTAMETAKRQDDWGSVAELGGEALTLARQILELEPGSANLLHLSPEELDVIMADIADTENRKNLTPKEN